MDTTTINGLHKCKAKNTPVEGQVKNMVVEHKPPRGDKKAWIKISNKSPEDGGSPYRILGVEKLPWPPDEHQNIAFNIEVEASSSQPSAFQQTKATMTNHEIDTTYERNDAIRSQVNEPIEMTTQSPPRRFNGGFEALDTKQRAIIRQHSQSMALEVLKLKVTLNELTVEDLTPAKLRQLADYFDNDVIGAATE